MIALAGVLAVLVGGWRVTNSRIFALRNLRVVGNVRLTTSQVERLAGLTRTTNVFWFSSGKAEGKLTESPWVAGATVSRTLPGDVVIRVIERSPVAVVAAPAGRPSLVAADGTVLGPAGRAGRLPLISVLGSLPSPGGHVDARTPGLVVAAALPGSVRRQVASIDVAADGQIMLWLKDGVRVLFGDASEAPAKVEALSAVLSWTSRNGAHLVYVDVQAPSAPAVLPGGTAVAGP